MFTLKMFESVYFSSLFLTSSMLDLFEETLHGSFPLSFYSEATKGKSPERNSVVDFMGIRRIKKQPLMPGKT